MKIIKVNSPFETLYGIIQQRAPKNNVFISFNDYLENSDPCETPQEAIPHKIRSKASLNVWEEQSTD